MSEIKPLQTVTQLAEARRAAAACGHVDINSTVQQCPASQVQLFVVPVRYALSEEPVTHAAFQPGVDTQSHPMAARLLRVGFIYVWQGKGPLQRYAVAENNRLRKQALDDDDTVVVVGDLSGIALAKHQSAWMLYSEIPLKPQHCEHLNDPEVRARRMRCLDLRTVANTLQAPHCVPLQDAAQVIGELIPKTYDLTLAMDFQRDQQAYRRSVDELGDQLSKKHTSATIKSYTDAVRWLNEREQIAANYPQLSEDVPPPGEWSAQTWAPTASKTLMEIAHEQSSGLHSVLACLDDDLGVLRDINHEQELVESRHEQWQTDNNLRLSIGGFVRSLITEDGAELSGQVNYRYREHNLVLTDDQGKAMLAAHHRLDELFKEESNINQARGGYYSHKQANALLHKVHAEVKATVAPLRSFIPPQLHTEIEAVVRDYRDDKIANLENRHASDKVEEYINLPAMNTWLDTTAPAHFAKVQERHESLFSDRGLYLQRHHSATWQVDYSDPDHTQWLDTLAVACLSGQCIRTQGAEQYADYLRTADEGALRQLFYSWSPTLEAAVNSNTRATELIAALGMENQANAKQAIIKVLGVLSEPSVTRLGVRAQDNQGSWATLVKRLGAALLLLKGEHGNAPGGSWLAILVAARLGSGVGLRAVEEGALRTWELFGKAGEDITQWAKKTGNAMGSGQVSKILNSQAVKGSGGLVALAALLLNSWNAQKYLSQAEALEGMDRQRINDTASATLYAGAALVAVIDNQIRSKVADRVFTVKFSSNKLSSFPSLTLFGALIGGISSIAALNEFYSLQQQLENAHGSIDVWLDLRYHIVGGQIATYGAQALLGIYYTARAVAGAMATQAAITAYALWMGPLNLLIAVLGVLYLIAWYFQQTPMQKFLNSCCWSKARASDLSPISVEKQQDELNRLYGILYTPRVSFKGRDEPVGANSYVGVKFTTFIDSLTIDLPGAELGNAHLEIAMIGNPVDSPAMWSRIKNGEGRLRAEEPMQTLGDLWIKHSRCEWIPYTQGQGLRLTGNFLKVVPGVFVSQPSKVSLRLRYRTPLTSLLGALSYVGGERGVAFTVSSSSGVVELRNDPTPELDRAPNYVLGNQEFSVLWQQGLKK
ncbi:toxin VasX [Pseudomonas sp. TMW22091]|uniref:toxin VasX n=1 Tax=Pseudomonas sp. TMW22091 TaxID=2506435 RepID=UPI001F110B0D|nr:toxin VasX [Pseudomonas sp. TMW22091]